MVLKVCFCVPV
uniref:Uncharacterized protein n=1 Tax=Anguilla anguilla TaxID=7936 RepID=A0A0E9UE52_ANGAN